MSSNINILKWLFALVLIFGGFTVYKIFGVLAADLEGKEYVWLVKIISEFGLFTSVVISVGFFHLFFAIKQESWKFLTVFTCLSRLEECPICTGSLNLNALRVTLLNRKNGTCRTFSWTTFKGDGMQKEKNWIRPTNRI